MSGFNAGKSAPALDFDFNPYLDVKGTVPEPSQSAIKQFNKTARALSGGKSNEEIAKLPYEDQEVIGDGMKPAIAELCNGTPSLDQLDELPFRALMAFQGWLMGSLKNPTS